MLCTTMAYADVDDEVRDFFSIRLHKPWASGHRLRSDRSSCQYKQYNSAIMIDCNESLSSQRAVPLISIEKGEFGRATPSHITCIQSAMPGEARRRNQPRLPSISVLAPNPRNQMYRCLSSVQRSGRLDASIQPDESLPCRYHCPCLVF